MKEICRISGEQFEITEADLAFYDSVSPTFAGRKFQIQTPSHSPDVRSLLRCLHRNERGLHKRTCDLSGKGLIAMYPAGVSFPVYSQESFFSDRWNALDYGLDYDSSRSFFDQLGHLYETVPHLGIINKQCQNSDYCNYSYANKNCYLTFGSHYEEDCLHGAYSTRNRSCVDCFWLYGSELSYECVFCGNCYHCVYLDYCDNCSECFFSKDLKGCRNCLFCANLHHQEYCVFNEQLSKEDYFRTLHSYRLNSASGMQEARRIYFKEIPKKFPVRAIYQTRCQGCLGSTLTNCKNMRNCFYCSDSQDCAYGRQIDCTNDSMDMDFMGYDRSELVYQTIGCLGLFHAIGCNACWNGDALYYCQYCFSSSNCFGCISLQQQSYCILNRQYNRDDYETLAAKIAEEMTARNEWGQFFPPDVSPFGYNKSMAYHISPLSREESHAMGFPWEEENKRNWDPNTVMTAKEIPDAIENVPDGITTWVILSETEQKAFRINKTELEFYRQTRLPVPRLSPEERQLARMRRRQPCNLWERQCAKTGKKILSTYAPHRPEIVYDEAEFLREMYS